MAFQLTQNVNMERDEEGVVRQLEHIQEPFVPQPNADLDEAESPARAVAEDYLREVAPIYGISGDTLARVGDSFTDAKPSATEGAQIRFAKEDPMMGTTTLSYEQTYQGIPIWEAGVKVTVQESPMRVTSSQSSVHLDAQADDNVSFDDSGQEKYAAEHIDESVLPSLLGSPDYPVKQINDKRLFFYRYDPARRFDPEVQVTEEDALQHGPPTLPLPPVPESIRPGVHYKVTEVLFTMPAAGWGEINWSALVEAKTGAVLLLRALVSCVATGAVFRFDPVTTTGDTSITPAAAAAVLDGLRTTINLEGLRAPANPADPQGLNGEFVRLVDIGPPIGPTPTSPLPGNFSFPVRSSDFAAVNAYHHCDGLFRMMQGMGFPVHTYFDGTVFPVRVDHAFVDDGGQVNASAPGNATRTGSDGFRFAFAAAGQPVSIATDARVVLHEFGHTLLWDSVHWPNFGFAHSAGDSLAAILADPGSRAPDRFSTFPWITAIAQRRHDRAVGAGWAWGGVKDVGGYSSEQILSTTHFRLYRSAGGDDAHRNVKDAAARYTVYLIIRAIGLLGSGTITPTPRPDIYATKLMEADAGTRNFEGRPGGTLHKVIRWSFEKQGLYQPAGTPSPVTREGAPPQVDVYIDDGRRGEYQFQPDVWNTRDIWNRLSPDGGLDHQPPAAGATNHAYVRVKNRGSRQADNVVVRGYTARLATGLVWPEDWQPMGTALLQVPGGIAPAGETVVGPFRWTAPASGQAALLMSVSAAGDLSNIDANSFLPCAAGPTPEWMLVPFDNNIARRNVTVASDGGGGLTDEHDANQFEVKNSSDKDVQVELKAVLPDALAARNWGVQFDNPGGGAFALGPGKRRSVFFNLVPGEQPDDAAALAGAAVEVQTYMDGALAGVVSYDLGQNFRSPVAALSDGAAIAPLLSQLNPTLSRVKSVTLRKLSLDIEFGE